MTLVYLSVAFAAGILLGKQFNLPAWSMAIALVPLPLLLLKKHRKPIIISVFCLLALFGGFTRYHSSVPVINENHVQYYNDGGTMVVRGMVCTDPDVTDKSTHITIEVATVWPSGWPSSTLSFAQPDFLPHAVRGKVLIFAPRNAAYRYGDIVQVYGRLETPTQFDDFDYKGYLAGRGIYSTMSYPDIVVMGGGGAKPLRWFYSVRRDLSSEIERVLPEPQAALAQGIVLGMRASIPASVNDDFVRTGAAHILAISGQNLSIIAGLFIAAGIWLFGKRHYRYVWLALAAVWGYALLTGLSAPVVRSAIMLSLFLCADLLGRQRSVLPALAFAAAVMLALTPGLLWDASFQLSFLSMLGLVLVAEPLQSFGRGFIESRLGEEGALVSSLKWLSDSLSVTVGVLLVIWPVIAHYFGVFSVAAPLSNLLILPALPAIMVSSALASVLGLVFLPLGQAVGWLAWLFNSYVLAVTHGLAGLPSAAVSTGQISPVWIWAYFGALALAMWLVSARKRVSVMVGRVTDFLAGRSKKYVMPSFAVLAALSVIFAANMPDTRTRVSFLDVGQGDAILIQSGQEEILIDGGPGSAAVTKELGRSLPFFDRTIELVVLTHPHADHITGLIEVLKRYQVGRVLYAESNSTSPLWAEWLGVVKERKVAVTTADTGQVITTGDGGLSIEVLSAGGGDDETLDAGGIVLRVNAGKISFLLTADIVQETELKLISERANLDSTVLKVAHHGSYTATSSELLSVVTPQVAVISVGAENDYGHPSREVLDRLADIPTYRTDVDGTIEFITDGERLWVRKDR